MWNLDLSTYQSVEKFAARVESLERLDVLVENAGINATSWSLAEGQERTITGTNLQIPASQGFSVSGFWGKPVNGSAIRFAQGKM